MMQAAGLIVRTLHAGGGLLLFGTLAYLLLAGRPASPRWLRSWLRVALCLATLTAALAIGILALQTASVPAEDTAAATVRRLLSETRFGMVWLVREALLAGVVLTLALTLLARASGWLIAAATLAGGHLVAAAYAGHAAAIEPAWPAVVAHALHLLAIGAWWGALPAVSAAVLAGEPWGVSAFQRFSRLALPLMMAIVASGAVLAALQVERWPALLGTAYGALLCGKLALLAPVLWLAARLRWRLLPALAAASPAARGARVARWIAIECLVGALIVAIAAQLTQTVPARHDAVQWWLPLRLSVDATWDTPWVPEKVASAAALALCGAVLLGLGAMRRLRRGRALPAGMIATLCGAALAIDALSVDAYPDTYRRPSVPYQTISVAQGATLFAKHCTGCHGRTGRGDGELGRGLPVKPADLTEPHTALHTAGDIFWWLTHGKPPGIMPGFGGLLSEDERWDLVNFLRTLSLGYQARIVSERVVPGRPWLPAIDFNFTMRDGTRGTLKDFRGRSAVVLVFFTLPGSAQRLAALARDAQALRRAGAAVLAIPAAGGGAAADLPVVEEGAEETARSYALLRRTLAQPDSADAQPLPPHMELLVDRYGYVRARWLPGDSAGWEDSARLLEQVALLAREPQVKPPPDDHVH